MTQIQITPGISIDEDEIAETFVQASGPGGQNVNKVATAVQIRFDAMGSPSLPEALRARLKTLAGRRLTKDGVLVIVAQRFRTQERNRADARARLVALLAEAAMTPKPRMKTRPSYAAKQRRRADKAARADVKRERTRRDDD
ncbi:MAG: hypothetical protein RJB62_935 [Pseudomonadota bacterium]